MDGDGTEAEAERVRATGVAQGGGGGGSGGARSGGGGRPAVVHLHSFTWSEGGSQKTKEMWIVDAPAPREYPRVVKQNAAARDSLRPSKLAATAKVRHVRDHLVADGIEGDWDEPEER